MFLLLAGLYPVVFLVSKNWFVYETRQLLFLLIIPTLTFVAGILYIFICWVVKKILKYPIPNVFKKIVNLVVKAANFINLEVTIPSILGFYTLYFLLDTSFGPSRKIRYGFIALAIVACLWIRKKGFYFVNVGLLIMSLMATGELVHSVSTGSIRGDTLITNIDKARDGSIKFTTKPNIYLIHLESFQSPTAMKYLYNLDNSAFVSNLSKLGFFVSQNNFSNYHGTLTSTASIFLQEHNYYKLDDGLNDSVGIRDMVGGRLYNPALATLKNNGYKLEYYHFDSYNFFGSDYLDYYYPSNNIHDSLVIFQNPQINRWRAKVFGMAKPKRRVAELKIEDKENFKKILWSFLDTKVDKSAPYFYYIKFSGADHSPPDGTYNWKDSEGKWIEEYRKLVVEDSPDILEMANKIVERDPTAIVIMYGDHGATRYRDIMLNAKKGADANKVIYDRRKIKGYDLALDMFGVFVAVRYPGGNAQLLDGETHVNMLRMLFSALSGDKSLLNNKPANESYLRYQDKLLLLVKDGKILDQMQLMDIPK